MYPDYPAVRLAVMCPSRFHLVGLIHFMKNELLFNINIVAETDCLRTLVEMQHSVAADIIVTDIAGLGEDAESGIRFLKTLKQQCSSLRLIVLTRCKEQRILLQLNDSLVSAVIASDEPAEIIRKYFLRAMNGECIFSPLISDIIEKKHPTSSPRRNLTPTEERVLQLMLAGLGINDIAERQKRSIKTISTHKSNIILKLDVESEVALFAYCATNTIGYNNK